MTTSAPLVTVLTRWLALNPQAVRATLSQGNTPSTLFDVYSMKSFDFYLSDVVDFREQPHPQGQGTYLNLVWDSGRQVALFYKGIAFTPDFTNTGPLPDAPPVSCFSDYAYLKTQLDALIADPERRLEAIRLLPVLISLLDGARAVGFDVSSEEKTLDMALEKLEK
jgi:hypothetical protein